MEKSAVLYTLYALYYYYDYLYLFVLIFLIPPNEEEKFESIINKTTNFAG